MRFRSAYIRDELERLADWAITPEKVATVLGCFDALWQAMNVVER